MRYHSAHAMQKDISQAGVRISLEQISRQAAGFGGASRNDTAPLTAQPMQTPLQNLRKTLGNLKENIIAYRAFHSGS